MAGDTITTDTELDALPLGSVILDVQGYVHQFIGFTSEHPDTIWRGTDGSTYYGSTAIVRRRGPFTVLRTATERE